MNEKWRIYYDDGTVLSSLDCKWEDAPQDGVQVICDFVAGRLHAKTDYYLMEAHDTICNVPLPHLERYLREDKRWKFGRWEDHLTFERILEEARFYMREKGFNV